MIRKIECMKCWRSLEMLPTPAEDTANGWKRRVVTIRDKKPLSPNLSSIMCDLCGQPIPGEAKAVTLWNENHEGEPLNWESEYDSL